VDAREDEDGLPLVRIGPVRLGKPAGEEDLNGLAHHLVRVVAEQLLGPPGHQGDPVVPVGDHHAVRGVLEERLDDVPKGDVGRGPVRPGGWLGHVRLPRSSDVSGEVSAVRPLA
jgi:hypothetical protein